MEPNPYKAPATPVATASTEKNANQQKRGELMTALIWTNVGAIFAYLLFMAFDWAYINSGFGSGSPVQVPASKLLFILIATNVIVYYAVANKFSGPSDRKRK